MGEPSDPVEYLNKHTEYHDRWLTVGDPSCEQVEKIGVVACNLAAHSTVFRQMFLGKLGDPSGTNTHITDVTPRVFKVMLVHMYGGKIPALDQATAAKLLLCADKYNVQPLVMKASKFLKPSTTKEVFLALNCVVYVRLPDLEFLVSKIVQERTQELINAIEFLELDVNCVEFVTKQETLAVTELQLFKGLLQWAKKKSTLHKNTNCRFFLNKPLKYLRLVTLTQDEFVKEIIPTGLLTPEEILDVFLASTCNKELKSTGLCSLKNQRQIFVNNKAIPPLVQMQTITKTNATFSPFGGNFILSNNDSSSCSGFSITVLKSDIELKSFLITSKPLPKKYPYFPYICSCTVVVHCFDERGVLSFIENIKVCVKFPSGEDLNLSLQRNGSFIVLKPNSKYFF